MRIALHLARVLRPWLEGRQASFLRFCAEEAQELGRRALGPLILQELGVVYKQVAGQYLGAWVGVCGWLVETDLCICICICICICMRASY